HLGAFGREQRMPPQLSFIHRVSQRFSAQYAVQAHRDGKTIDFRMAKIKQDVAQGSSGCGEAEVSGIRQREQFRAQDRVASNGLFDGRLIYVRTIEQSKQAYDRRRGSRQLGDARDEFFSFGGWTPMGHEDTN